MNWDKVTNAAGTAAEVYLGWTFAKIFVRLMLILIVLSLVVAPVDCVYSSFTGKNLIQHNETESEKAVRVAEEDNHKKELDIWGWNPHHWVASGAKDKNFEYLASKYSLDTSSYLYDPPGQADIDICRPVKSTDDAGFESCESIWKNWRMTRDSCLAANSESCNLINGNPD